ncbi:uncharacterized protein LOC125314295 [Rhodamnia argentea]|uniref:Uncharacterized protein LOC125314295 n=1 Tax=Rhodamnia argentea TaxID=178133 RepID=A0ABM3H6I4_9MYRT|nr:uncharacterized protein LOC125314295 [Rhodamnia argentea]
MAEVMQALGAMGELIGQRIRNQNAAAAATVEAPPVVPPAVPPMDVPPLAVVEDRKAQKMVEQVVPAVYQLEGNAGTWWRVVKDRVFPEGTVPVWDTFVEAFNNKYFSRTAREQKMAEFFRLRQNQMTVDQYEAKFSELSKYAPRLIEDPEDRARRFGDGLKPEIKSVLAPFNLQDYDDLYERAPIVERDLGERTAASGSRFTSSNRFEKRQGKKPMYGGGHHIPPNRRGAINKPVFRQSDVCNPCHRETWTRSVPV